jgi:4-amino-4-deoxy-L-arabinose transferase-like glycosyltransferase
MFLPDGITTVPSFEPFYERIHATRHIKECKEIPADNAGLYMLLSGLFLGFASLVRPVGLYLFIVSLIFIVLSRDAWREKIRKSAIFFVMWFIPVAVWLIRNYVLLGHNFFIHCPVDIFYIFQLLGVVAQEDIRRIM